MTMTALYPFAAATSASPMPVLPLVASMIVPPGFNLPAFSASSTMLMAMRSLTLEPGFWYSSLT
ncbi:hypothetical protein D1872_344620 [compost metagenome]